MKILIPFLSILLLTTCDAGGDDKYITIQVTATAYNATESQTRKGSMGIAAWGDTLRPGMKAIAVSRDLIDSGLTHNTVVKIEDLDGYYRVLDKMNKRWTRKIDIFMGTDRDSALLWGKKKVWISWEKKDD